MWYIYRELIVDPLVDSNLDESTRCIYKYIYMWCVRYTMYHVRSYVPIATHTMAPPMEGGVQIVSWSVVRPYAIFLSFLLAPFVVTYDVGTYGNLRWTIVLWIRRRGTRFDSVEADGCLCSFRFPERDFVLHERRTANRGFIVTSVRYMFIFVSTLLSYSKVTFPFII